MVNLGNVRQISSGVEQLTRNEQVKGSIPFSGYGQGPGYQPGPWSYMQLRESKRRAGKSDSLFWLETFSLSGCSICVMAKKHFLTALLLSLSLSFIFAGQPVFDIHISPYSSRQLTIDNQTYNSDYGLSAEIGYRNYIWHGLSVGGDFTFSFYKFNEISDINIYTLMAKSGWTYKFEDKHLSATADLEIGLDLTKTDRKLDVSFRSAVDARMAYKLNNILSVTAGLNMGLSFHDGKPDFSFSPKFGLLVSPNRFPFHGAGIGLIMNGRILMGKRSTSPYKDTWTVPGGEVDKRIDENELTAAIRELNEETGIDFSKLSVTYLGKWTIRVPFFSWTTYFYEIKEIDQKMTSDEFQELQWLDYEEIIDGSYKDKDFRPFTKAEMKKLRSLSSH